MQFRKQEESTQASLQLLQVEGGGN
jgi:hypothetical protein